MNLEKVPHVLEHLKAVITVDQMCLETFMSSSRQFAVEVADQLLMARVMR
jgi:hypothetical protein